MKKIFLFIMLISLSLISNAQDFKFNLRNNGSFVDNKEGNDFVVVPFEGKTAQELYSMVKSNILTLYKSPKDVLSENEPASLTIRALSDKLYSSYKLAGGFVEYYAYYNLTIHFKDGRIKVDSPKVDSKLLVKATGTPMSKSFSSFVGDMFDKNGSPKEKKKDDINKIESCFNSTIYYVLGYYNKNAKNEEDW